MSSSQMTQPRCPPAPQCCLLSPGKFQGSIFCRKYDRCFKQKTVVENEMAISCLAWPSSRSRLLLSSSLFTTCPAFSKNCDTWGFCWKWPGFWVQTNFTRKHVRNNFANTKTILFRLWKSTGTWHSCKFIMVNRESLTN